ncbi:SWIM zinc finger family protein [Halobaculum halobium]|uniref:SWIM zinc finger family protein n=1 Tax=Halobaculum halobium TaxID=3032281 RepID=A0ABD5THZ6_9EURY|nr:SWIM zinc finger family protein [Halobaculum sp. SYNS20]
MTPADALRQLAPTTRVLKRAQYEAFEFSIRTDGIHVRNASYADPENHEYLVTLSEEIPAACTCPADARFDGACKHRVAVAIRSPVLAAARDVSTTRVAADGGERGAVTPRRSPVDTDSIDEDDTPAGGGDVETPEDCECDGLDGFPCWACVDAGRRTVPE